MKKGLLVVTMLCLLVLLVPTSRGGVDPNTEILTGYDTLLEMGASDSNDYPILSFMAQQNQKPSEGTSFARLGYRYGISEPYIGFEIEEGRTVDFGLLFHSRDIVEPGSVPVLSAMALIFFSPEMELTSYSGLHIVKAKDEDYTGAIAGLEGKLQQDSNVSARLEVHYENNLAEDVIFFAGLCWKF